jgi:hypothetical protein
MIIILGLILIAAAGLLGHRPVHQQASAGHPESLNCQAAPDVPADTRARSTAREPQQPMSAARSPATPGCSGRRSRTPSSADYPGQAATERRVTPGGTA